MVVEGAISRPLFLAEERMMWSGEKMGRWRGCRGADEEGPPLQTALRSGGWTPGVT